MKNGLLLCAVASLALSLPVAASAGTTAHGVAGLTPAHKVPVASARAKVQAPQVKVAPADEYFGHQKLSILGINNTIHDTNLRIGFDPTNAARYYGQLAPAEDSLLDWAHKYPQDTWLPGRAYFMSHVFWQMHTAQGDSAAEQCRGLLFKQFPKSHWATLAHRETKEILAPVEAAAPAAGAAVTAVGGGSTSSGSAQAAPGKPKQ